ncbi:helix-turn-helix transcriptional regulator [Bosea sp. (in: a-proteobacteria)]|uniref:helix-turn-helix domain-containing protein n=1 Tax=Bosea sp. (in: a-proteobacteria) TaxID=1871050 RepID=UPI002DDD2695|nr:helix-turn-helix transcriptional regulator [Bosea sp. (in: a-proteobacteria)]HEV2512673.1 helix-turn-helix transcriptional regulator [Bosea sp. (in: a-proteobacteria)]
MRRIRVAAGLSQDEVAVRMGVEQTYVSGLERGVRNPTLTTVDRAAVALNVKITELLEETAVSWSAAD